MLYVTVVWAVIAFGIAVLVAGFDAPYTLLVLSAAMNGVVMFLYSGLLLWLNWTSFAPPLRPSWPRALALVQLVGPIGLQAADAILEAHEYETPIHLDGENREECGDGHAHLICQTVRSLGAGLLTADAMRGIALSGVESDLAQAPAFSEFPKAPSSGPLGSRAPPQA